MRRSPLRAKPCGMCGAAFRHRQGCRRYHAPKPMSRPSKPIAHRNAKRRPAALATAQREAVLARDVTCAFEVLVSPPESAVEEWMRCGARDLLQTCHVVRRHLCGDAWADPDVAIAGCVHCHDAADHRSHPDTWSSVRFPATAIERAMKAIRNAEADRAARGLAVVPIPDAARERMENRP